MEEENRTKEIALAYALRLHEKNATDANILATAEKFETYLLGKEN